MAKRVTFNYDSSDVCKDIGYLLSSQVALSDFQYQKGEDKRIYKHTL